MVVVREAEHMGLSNTADRASSYNVLLSSLTEIVSPVFRAYSTSKKIATAYTDHLRHGVSYFSYALCKTAFCLGKQ